jgi:hypothetical protein
MARLIEAYDKPVIDDEPARTGLRDFGRRPDSRPEQHLAHVVRVRTDSAYNN